MSFHGDLLRQARHLAQKEPRRPRQASLRRAISAAYYALFHLLIDEATRFVVRGKDRDPLRVVIARAFAHDEMKRAARAFGGGTPPRALQTAAGAIPADLKRVAETFVELQQARHEADYDLGRRFTRRETLDLIGQAEAAFSAWEKVRNSQAADAFLVALLLYKRLERR